MGQIFVFILKLHILQVNIAFFLSEEVIKLRFWDKNNRKYTRLICQWIIMYWVQYWKATRDAEILCYWRYRMTCLRSSLIVRQSYHFTTDWSCAADILNTLFKYWMSYRQRTCIIEIFEPLIKSCENFCVLFVNIQCTTACSLEKLNFKV